MVVLSLHTGTSDHGNGRIDSDVTRGLWVAQVRRLVSDDGCGDMAANLYGAARSGDVVEVRGLVAAGSDVEERGEDGGTPLHVAGHVEVMRVLLEMDAEKEAKDDNGSRPLHQAAYSGHVEAMELLVQMGAEKDAKDANGRTPLHWAAAMGHVEAMQLLVQLRTLGVRFGGSLALRALALS